MVYLRKISLNEAQELKEICSQEIISVEKVIYFC